MQGFIRDSVTPFLALACALTVFVAAALESPDDARALAAPALTAP